MLLKLLKPGLLLLAAVAAAWIAVIGYWRLAARDPGAVEIVALLALAPLALIGLWIFLQRGFDRLQRPGSERTPATNEPPHPPTAPAAPRPLLYWQTALPIGADSAEAFAMLRAGTIRPGLDERLKDEQGFPVFAARCVELPDEVQALRKLGGLAELTVADSQTWQPEQLRALSLAQGLLDDFRHDMLPRMLATLQGDSQTLELVIALPDSWSDDSRKRAAQWLYERLLTTRGAETVLRYRLLDPACNSRQSPYFDTALLAENPTEETTNHLLLACDSAIGESAVRQWDAEGALFHQANPRGRIPAEGAALLLLGSANTAQAAPHQPSVLIHCSHRAVTATDSADASLGSLTQQALATCEWTLADIAAVISDAGLQPEPAVELGMLLTETLPHLDHASDALQLGTACGDLGIASELATLAMAATACAEQRRPVLMLGQRLPTARGAILLSPSDYDSRPRSQAEAAIHTQGEAA